MLNAVAPWRSQNRTTRGGRRFKPKLTYANVTSTLALFIALAGGTAYAATYVVTSITQIQPAVRDMLRPPVLHSFYGGSAYVRNATGGGSTPGPWKVYTRLRLPEHSASLVEANLTANINGAQGDKVFGQCALLVSTSLYDISEFTNSPDGSADAVPVSLELSVPAQNASVRAVVECRMYQQSGGNDGIYIDFVQEDAVQLQ
jgi:hypothetical protein